MLQEVQPNRIEWSLNDGKWIASMKSDKNVNQSKFWLVRFTLRKIWWETIACFGPTAEGIEPVSRLQSISRFSVAEDTRNSPVAGIVTENWGPSLISTRISISGIGGGLGWWQAMCNVKLRVIVRYLPQRFRRQTIGTAACLLMELAADFCVCLAI